MLRLFKARIYWILCSAVLLATLHGAFAAQQAGQLPSSSEVSASSGKADTKDGDAVFKTQIDRVVLNAAVLDRDQRLVTGLSQQAFRVDQDGKQVTLTGFSNRDIPVSMGLIIDSSASMTNKRRAVNSAALALVRASHPEDEVFVVNFNDDVELTQDYTSNVSALEHALSDVRMWGGTAMLDAVQLAMDHLHHATKGKKVLLIVTDGEDNSSRTPEKTLLANLQKSEDITVYAIGLLSEESSSARAHARKMLQTITQTSGGAVYFPADTEEVGALATKIANDIRNQYVLEFAVPDGTKPGPHTLRVSAISSQSGKLTVRTRPKYVYQPATG